MIASLEALTLAQKVRPNPWLFRRPFLFATEKSPMADGFGWLLQPPADLRAGSIVG